MTDKTAGPEQCRARYPYLHEAIDETWDVPNSLLLCVYYWVLTSCSGNGSTVGLF